MLAMATREHPDSHDTNVSVKSTINFNGPIIILGGSILLVFIMVGIFIFATYCATHWDTFTQQLAPALVTGVLWLVGIVAFTLAGYAVLRLIGHTGIDLVLKFLHGWADYQQKRTLANVAHFH